MNYTFIDEGYRIVVHNGEWTEATYYEDESAFKYIKYLLAKLEEKPSRLKKVVKKNAGK